LASVLRKLAFCHFMGEDVGLMDGIEAHTTHPSRTANLPVDATRKQANERTQLVSVGRCHQSARGRHIPLFAHVLALCLLYLFLVPCVGVMKTVA